MELLICEDLDKKLCEKLLQFGADADISVDNLDRLDVFVKDFPSGSSYQGLLFYLQDVVNDGWRLYNYGPTGNL